MSFIQAPDGANLHYELHGHGPRDLIFLHGIPGSGVVWREVVERLDPTIFRSIVVDLRGHGRSEPGNRPLDFAQVQSDLLLIAENVRSVSACWVTHSGSGKNAIWMAAQVPNRVRQLVLVAPAGFRALPMPREAVAALVAAARDRAQMETLAGQWFQLGCGDGYAAFLRSLENCHPRVIQQTLAMWGEQSVEVQARALTQPILVVLGARERVYTREFLQGNMLALLPRAQVETIEAGHLIPLDAPAALAELLTLHSGKTRQQPERRLPRPQTHATLYQQRLVPRC